MVRRRQVVHATVLVLGVVLIGTGFALQGHPEYSHHVERTSESALSASAEPLEYRTLSPVGQSVLDRGIASADGTVTVPSDGRVPEFSYGDAADTRFVHTDGQYYRVSTSGGGVLSGGNEIVGWVLVGFGALAVLGGGYDLVRHSEVLHQ